MRWRSHQTKHISDNLFFAFWSNTRLDSARGVDNELTVAHIAALVIKWVTVREFLSWIMSPSCSSWWEGIVLTAQDITCWLVDAGEEMWEGPKSGVPKGDSIWLGQTWSTTYWLVPGNGLQLILSPVKILGACLWEKWGLGIDEWTHSKPMDKIIHTTINRPRYYSLKAHKQPNK